MGSSEDPEEIEGEILPSSCAVTCLTLPTEFEKVVEKAKDHEEPYQMPQEDVCSGVTIQCIRPKELKKVVINKLAK